MAISASEKQKDGTPLKSFADFQNRLAEIGLSVITCMKPIGYWGLTFWEHSVYADAQDQSEVLIHSILFPGSDFKAPEPDRMEEGDYLIAHQKWRNRKCDILAFWSHWKNGREFFVTGDENFHKVTKQSQLEQMAKCKIVYPEDVLNAITYRP